MKTNNLWTYLFLPDQTDTDEEEEMEEEELDDEENTAMEKEEEEEVIHFMPDTYYDLAISIETKTNGFLLETVVMLSNRKMHNNFS